MSPRSGKSLSRQGLKKLDADIRRIEQRIRVEGFERLAIEPAHLSEVVKLPMHHRDPFDHLLMAQAIGEMALFVTDDRIIRRYPVKVFDETSVR